MTFLPSNMTPKDHLSDKLFSFNHYQFDKNPTRIQNQSSLFKTFENYNTSGEQKSLNSKLQVNKNKDQISEIGYQHFYRDQNYQQKSQSFRNQNSSNKSQSSMMDLQSLNDLRTLTNPKKIIKREYTIIKVDQNKQKQILQAKKGLKADTKELNINMKSNLQKIIRKQKKISKLTRQQTQKLEVYEKSSASFYSTQRFLGYIESGNGDQGSFVNSSGHINELCFKNFSSCSLLINFLKSKKMRIKNKLICLKYLQKMRMGTIFPQQLRIWKTQ